MRIVLLSLTIVLIPIVAVARDSGPVGFEHGSDGSLKQLEQTFKAEAIGSPSHMSSHRLQDFPNDTFMLAVREADGVVEWHENLPDVFIVESGSAALIVGGKMVGGERADHMKNATARSKVAPG